MIGGKGPCHTGDATSTRPCSPVVAQTGFFHSVYPHSDLLAGHLRKKSSPHSPMASREGSGALMEERSLSGRPVTECLWKVDPSQWWDEGESKKYPRSPDFKNKIMKESLGIEGSHNPGLLKGMLEEKPKASTSQAQDFGLVECGKAGVKVNALKAQELCKKTGWETLSVAEALTSMEHMQQPPSVQDLTGILHMCRRKKNLAYTKRLYAYLCKNGLEDHRSIGNYIIPMLVQVGSMCDAQQVFNKLVDRNEYSWTALIWGYIELGDSKHALNLYQKMQEDYVHPSKYTLAVALKACARVRDIERGREVHAEIARKGLERYLVVCSKVVDMYAKCGSLAEAWEAFDKLLVRDEVLWNALIAGYAQHGFGEEAFKCLKQMQMEGLSPNAVTFICSLKACGSIRAMGKGREMHAEIGRKGLERDLVVGSALVDMYAKCGSLAEARGALDKLPVRNEVSWNALIARYAEHGLGEEALNCLEQMQLEGLFPTAVTFVCSIKACGSIGAIDKGREMHTEIARKGLERDLVVCSTLVDMYAKCGLLAEAREGFDKLQVRDEVSWTALIAVYAEHGLGDEALTFFEQMQLEGLSADAVAYACSLKACGSIGAIDNGREMHVEIARKGMEKDLVAGNTLVCMYAKCGSLVEAWEAVDKLLVRDEFSWNAVIAGFAQHGESEMVFHMLGRMRREGIKPDEVTFSIIFAVCSHTGLVDKGENYFEAMSRNYGITPTIEHHIAMVDLFGRAGQLDEAVAMVKKIAFHPDPVAWRTVLGACRKWGNVELGRLAFEHAVQLDEKDAASFILMSNIYADAHMQEEEKKIEAMKVEKQAWKMPEQSWTDSSQLSIHFW